jgi:raffinose/stachyose/melibiose transport system substrate-binding protein
LSATRLAKQLTARLAFPNHVLHHVIERIPLIPKKTQFLRRQKQNLSDEYFIDNIAFQHRSFSLASRLASPNTGETMKFSRKAAITATVVVAAITLAGCSSSTSPAGTAATAKQTINVWGWAGAPGADVMAGVIKGFEKANPNITVKYTEISTADYKNKATLALSSKQPIDVIGVQPNAWAADNESYFLPVSKWPGESNLLSDFQSLPVAQDKKLFTDGIARSVPFGSSASAVGIYNVGILKKAGFTSPPTTWAEWTKLSDYLKGTGIVPAVMPADSWFQDEFVLTMVGEEDPSFYDDIRYNKGSYDTASYQAALADYKSLYASGELDPTTLDLAYSDADALFDQGKAAVLFNGSWEAGRLLPSYRATNKVQASDIGIMGVPAEAGGTVSARSFLDITYGIPTASKHQAAAAKFIAYATAGAGVGKWATALGFIPAVKGWKLPAGTLKTPVEQAGYAELQNLVAHPSSDRNNLSNLSAQIGTYILQVVHGTMTPAAAAKQAEADHLSGKYN